VIGRVVPPAASPLALAAVLAGVRAAVSPGDVAQSAAEALRRHLGGADARLLASGTAALTLALGIARDAALARGVTSPWVALPAYGCYDLATAAIGAQLRVRLYDLDPFTLAPDPAALGMLADEPSCAAVVLVHLYGLPVDVAALRAALGDSRALLIEDAAQGAGGRWGSSPLGTLGDLGVLSFGRGKGIIAGGGGAVISRSIALPPTPPAAASGLRAAVLTGAQWVLGRPALYGIPAALPFLGLGETVYKPPVPIAGMPRACAAMLPAALAAAEHAAMQRAEVAAGLCATAAAHGLEPIEPNSAAVPGWLRCPVLVPGGVTPAQLAAGRRLGIMPAYPGTLASLPPLRPHRDDPAAAFPGADRLVGELVTLPCHHLLSPRDLQRITVWLHDTGRCRGDASTHRL
jgi:dTDP-4-amino-4,6-dideoxygalactose transaminase